MKSVTVRSSRGSYPIFVGRNLLSRVGAFLASLSFHGKVMIVTQKKVARFYAKKIQTSLKRSGYLSCVHFVLDGEKAKSEKELFRLHHALSQQDFERRDMILALGGGVVGDLSGFAAATYLRGIDLIQIPTTLLAQVDSSIGGKTGINLSEGKNLVGAFYPPRLVVSDVAVLGTLSDLEFRASLAEVIKYGIIRDPALFRFLEKNRDPILKKRPQDCAYLVLASSKIKAGVVSRDERETKGERMILNFGHTFGHAFEQCLHYKRLVHGEAVAIGMAAAARLAARLKMLSASDEQSIISIIRRFHLPISLRGLGLSTKQILLAMNRDKKKKAGKLRFVLPQKIGRVIIRQDIPPRFIKSVLRELGAK